VWILRTAPGSEPDKTFRVLPGAARTLGRSTGADFIVDAPLVSRVHCRLTPIEDGGLELLDLDSTNGTYVNGKRVQASALSPGDRIGVGRIELIVERAD
jgi:pSer/pThr/pTyr-binding forkhead associated (FHA) protein